MDSRRRMSQMKILVTGSSGLVGSALLPSLKAKGHEVIRLVRSAPKDGATQIYWNPVDGTLSADALEGLDAVVHLAGDNLAEGRWTDEKKRAPAARGGSARAAYARAASRARRCSAKLWRS